MAARQPVAGIGALAWDWETIVPAEGGHLVWEGEPIYGVVRQEILEKETPRGVRRFEVAVVNRPARPPAASRQVVVYDHTTRRILMAYLIEPTNQAMEAEFAHLNAMSWESFRRFAGRPDRRRYLLD